MTPADRKKRSRRSSLLGGRILGLGMAGINLDHTDSEGLPRALRFPLNAARQKNAVASRKVLCLEFDGHESMVNVHVFCGLLHPAGFSACPWCRPACRMK
jgi:hypothetical protein